MRLFTSWRSWAEARPGISDADATAYEPMLPVLDTAAAAAARWHGDQLRPTGVPYMEHLLEALEVLVCGARVSDPDVLVATLLHDAVEDTPATLQDVEEAFGPAVAELVDWVTKPGTGDQGRAARRAAKAAYLRRLRSAPRQAVLVKLADRVSNVQRLDQMPAGFQRSYYAETVTYIEPLAETEPWFAAWFADWRAHFAHLR